MSIFRKFWNKGQKNDHCTGKMEITGDCGKCCCLPEGVGDRQEVEEVNAMTSVGAVVCAQP